MYRAPVGQLWRFAVVGVSTNGALYVAYLALTLLGVPYLASMSLVYAAGVVLGFVMHRRFTFRHRHAWGPAAARYLVAYAAGYALNWWGLWWLVERVHLGHEWSQALMIIVVAATLFVIQRVWVFADRPH